ncbi:LysM peptidoglycan-binding domain-containing protein [Flavobacterium covae]|uniref:LysM peptidoglycan-binding domain-containing protein n=1 Tax=Flavobacterium covae TaxID=2906076 RepID=UPI000745DF7F|nr:LysM peptidoglycan-binding domain-containing protein [Flavobacterium covae]AMA48764.1 peptidoglycan-binding protein [Flavobacterium covae]MCJ1808001.1 LysM peptidoglycan-binding domain-containing protein [Flavobacterium covae]
MLKYLLFIFFFLSQYYYAQQEKTFKHLIQKSETLESIALKYKVSKKEILKLNTGAEKGIQENTILIIPNVHSISYMFKKNDVNAVSYDKHEVSNKETLYSIAKQYQLSVEELKEANPLLVQTNIKEGYVLNIPQRGIPYQKKVVFDGKFHEVQSQETLFSIARLYNVSVKDLDEKNEIILKEGLQIGQKIEIPNKKKTLDGKARIINEETIFHIVQAKETKYSITKKYGITIDQLEKQNPEIINGLIIGNKLAINKNMIKAKNENEELMIALAEKQAVIEKSKSQTLKIEDLEDRLKVQKEFNKKMITLNKLNINLNTIDETKNGSVERLRLILDANKKIQEVLIAKLDSLVITMEYDLKQLKIKNLESLEESKRLQKESDQKRKETTDLVQQLKHDLSENRRIIVGVMQKVQKINQQENQEYKKKIREQLSDRDQVRLNEIKKIDQDLTMKEERKESLLSKINDLELEEKTVLKRKIAKATFYSTEARDYDDRLALVKLERVQKEIPITEISNTETTLEEKRKILNENTNEESTKIEIINNLPELETGYYLVANTFTESVERDAFALRLSYSGERQTKFFYNINNFGYYVYTNKYQTLEEALFEYKVKPRSDLFKKLFIVQIKKEL